MSVCVLRTRVRDALCESLVAADAAILAASREPDHRLLGHVDSELQAVCGVLHGPGGGIHCAVCK